MSILFGAAADVLRRIGEDAKFMQEFVELVASEAMDAEAALGSHSGKSGLPLAPPSLYYTLMRDPVILPSSKITVDRHVIQRHLLSDSTDPFNRSHLTGDMLMPNVELNAKITEFIKSQDIKRHRQDSSMHAKHQSHDTDN